MIPLKYKILFIASLLLISCKPKQVITEKISTKSDSSAVVLLEDEISKKETQIASLQSDLKRFKEENFILRNEVSTHEINYDTTLPINPQTQKPPMSSEIITNSNTQHEKNLNQYEILFQKASIENEKHTNELMKLKLTNDFLNKENINLKNETSDKNYLKILIIFILLIFIISLIRK